MFTENEIAYLKSQHLARLATVAADGQPDVAPVGFEVDGNVIYVGGHHVTKTRKYKNVQAGQTKVALVIDDLQSTNPWNPRGIRIYGDAELVEREGWLGRAPYIRITARVSWSWNIEHGSIHKTVHATTNQNSNVNRAAPSH